MQLQSLLGNAPAGAGTVTSVAQSFTGGLISVAGSPITGSGTLALTVAGTSGGVPYFSSASTWATSAALAANALVIGGGAGAAPATTTTGTGVLTALGNTTNATGGVVTTDGTATLTGKTLTDAVNNISAPGTTTVGYLGMPQNSKSAAYTTVMADAGKHILHPTADNNARTFTIDSNANVAYPIGTVITVVNQINTVTIAITSDTLTWFAGSGTASTGSRTLAAGGVATLLKVSSTGWIISGPGVSFFFQPKVDVRNGDVLHDIAAFKSDLQLAA
jgi:hypothetical protein